MLTKIRLKILKFIANYIKENGYSPSIREIGEEVGLSSTSSVYKQLNNLESSNYIKRKVKSPRALSLIEKAYAKLSLLNLNQNKKIENKEIINFLIEVVMISKNKDLRKKAKKLYDKYK